MRGLRLILFFSDKLLLVKLCENFLLEQLLLISQAIRPGTLFVTLTKGFSTKLVLGRYHDIIRHFGIHLGDVALEVFEEFVVYMLEF